MDLMPILSTLKRHKTAAGLIVLQIALTCAIVCNALFLIDQRLERMRTDSGLDEDHLVMLSVTTLGSGGNVDPQTDADLAALRRIPGVVSVTLTSQLPYGRNSSGSGIRTDPDERRNSALSASHYHARPDFLSTLGVRLAAGRDFTADEYVMRQTLDRATEEVRVPAILINRALAERLFPGEPLTSVIGKPVYVFGAAPQQVVGVLDTLVSPNPSSRNDNNLLTMVSPVMPSFRGGAFVLRVDSPERRADVLKAAEQTLLHNSPGMKRLVRDRELVSDMRHAYYAQDRSMIRLLIGVCGGLLVVTAFGIVGLASFWVQQRTRMIGTRRALGATRGQILRYFQIENLLLSTIGIVLGMAGAYGISLLLMRHYELPRLPWAYLPIGALALWALGQIAVLGPARRAARLSPVAALRGG